MAHCKVNRMIEVINCLDYKNDFFMFHMRINRFVHSNAKGNSASFFISSCHLEQGIERSI